MFFAPNGKYPPCGLYSAGHIIILLFTLLDVVISLYLALRYLKSYVKTVIRIFTVIVTVLEGIKIAFNFIQGYTALNHWVPLYFCSFYLFALWFAAFGKGKAEKTGMSFLFGGSILSGLSFLFYPSTSLPNYPLFHFLSLYSFFFHGSMIFMGLFIILSGYYKPKLKDGLYYILFTGILIGLAALVNVLFGANLMFITNPYRIPVMSYVYDISVVLYRTLLILAHLGFYFLVYSMYSLSVKNKKEEETLCGP
jgi:uncharacterized membrane protein YwaF